MSHRYGPTLSCPVHRSLTMTRTNSFRSGKLSSSLRALPAVHILQEFRMGGTQGWHVWSNIHYHKHVDSIC